jgi:hypothetical protein
MPSNDINGDPILVLSKEEAEEIVLVFSNIFRFGLGPNIKVYQKAKKFLEECNDSGPDRPSEDVRQKRLWPE